jgi:fermentation-respiration switch protein FrsA (DUF1100 family)
MHECIISGLRSINSGPDSIANWRSPVLLVHGDDDRNVPFQQTTDFVENYALKASRSKRPRDRGNVQLSPKTLFKGAS